MKAKPYRHYKSGVMNKTESAYEQHLKLSQRAGEIVSYHFETVKLKLANKTTYTPDFLVVTNECIELHEVKGRSGKSYWAMDDAKVKIKVAAKMLDCFKFKIVWPDGKGGWNEQTL